MQSLGRKVEKCDFWAFSAIFTPATTPEAITRDTVYSSFRAKNSCIALTFLRIFVFKNVLYDASIARTHELCVKNPHLEVSTLGDGKNFSDLQRTKLFRESDRGGPWLQRGIWYPPKAGRSLGSKTAFESFWPRFSKHRFLTFLLFHVLCRLCVLKIGNRG